MTATINTPAIPNTIRSNQFFFMCPPNPLFLSMNQLNFTQTNLYHTTFPKKSQPLFSAYFTQLFRSFPLFSATIRRTCQKYGNIYRISVQTIRKNFFRFFDQYSGTLLPQKIRFPESPFHDQTIHMSILRSSNIHLGISHINRFFPGNS